MRACSRNATYSFDVHSSAHVLVILLPNEHGDDRPETNGRLEDKGLIFHFGVAVEGEFIFRCQLRNVFAEPLVHLLRSSSFAFVRPTWLVILAFASEVGVGESSSSKDVSSGIGTGLGRVDGVRDSALESFRGSILSLLRYVPVVDLLEDIESPLR